MYNNLGILFVVIIKKLTVSKKFPDRTVEDREHVTICLRTKTSYTKRALRIDF